MAAPRRRRWLRAVLALLAVGLVVVALVRQWDEVGRSLDEVRPVTVVVSLLLVAGGTAAGMLGWRAILADLGSPLPLRGASHVFFLSQLGKYLPGSLWNVVAQMELARDLHVPRRRSGAAAVVALAVSTTCAVVLAALGAAALGADTPVPVPVLLVIVLVGLVGLHPPVLSALLDRVLRIARRDPLEHSLSRLGVLRAVGWTMLAWLLFGGHVWLLARDLGAGGSALLPLSIGAFAAAWSAGFLFFVAPAGAGAREGALVLGLSSVLPTAEATLLAVVSRLLFTVADLTLSGAAVAVHRTGIASARSAARAVAAADVVDEGTEPPSFP